MSTHSPVSPKAPPVGRPCASSWRSSSRSGTAGDAPGDLHLPLRSASLMDSLGVGRPAIRAGDCRRSPARASSRSATGRRARVAVALPSGRMVDQVSETMKHVLVQTRRTSLENLKEARVTFEAEMARGSPPRATPRRTSSAWRRSSPRRRPPLRQPDPSGGSTGASTARSPAISGNPIWTALSDALFSLAQRLPRRSRLGAGPRAAHAGRAPPDHPRHRLVATPTARPGR